jgi:DNA-binding MarR family transcriptional regulator
VSRKVPPTTDTAEAPPSVDALASKLMAWMGLSMQAARGESMRETLHLSHTHNLTMAMMTVLHVVGFEGKQTMTALSEQTGLSTSAMSHLLQRLVEQGLLERQDDAADRRVRRVALTSAGTALLSQMMRLRFADLRASVAPLSERTMKLLGVAVGEAVAELSVHLKAALPSCPRSEGAKSPPPSPPAPPPAASASKPLSPRSKTKQTKQTKEST